MSLPAGSVWIDVQGCQNVANFERGIARQAAESTEALLRIAPDLIHTVGLTPALPMPASLNFLLGSGKLGWVSGKGSEPDPRPSIYHVTSPFEGPTPFVTLEEQWPHWARRPGTRLVVTLHDLIPLIFSEHYIDPDPIHMSRWLSRLGIVRTADHILAVSQSSAADAVDHLGFEESRITVIDAGTSVQLASMVGSRQEASKVLAGKFPGLRDGYLFYVAGGDWRKNVTGLIEAYARLPEAIRSRHQLVITYKLDPEARENLEGLAASLGIHGDQLLLTGFVPDRELSALYRRCGLFVFPSLYEGAGLPILEAMACGAPVIGSNVSSVPEILGDLRATFDPSDPADIAACIARTLEDPSELERLRAVSAERTAHFTWDRVARKAIEGYERALAVPSHRDTSPRRRRRLAVFTPWPPERSGAAAYGRQLVERLADHADVDVIVSGDPGTYDRSLEPRVRLWPASDFDWVNELRDYDRILYMLGNSAVHREAMESLLVRSGVVMAHEVRFAALYRALEPRWTDNPVWLKEKLYEMYGDRIPAADLRRAPGDPALQDQFGIYMSEEIQRRAERVLVHSRYAADVLRMDRRPGDPGAETVVVGRGIPDAAQQRNGAAADRPPIVVSHGAGEHPESVDLLVHALAEVSTRHPGASLVVLGDLEEGAERRLRETASNLGLSGSVRADGRLEGEAYWRALCEADVAVELRTTSAGEASGSVCDCLAARVPTIVSAVGWLGELPDPAVIHVARECAPAELARAIERVLGDPELPARIRRAQDDYAEANSYERVAQRYAEILGL